MSQSSVCILDFPQVILDIEAVELGISAGLQDRVIQTYEGLVFMDFTGQKGIYERIDPNLLPPMYLAYNVNAGKLLRLDRRSISHRIMLVSSRRLTV